MRTALKLNYELVLPVAGGKRTYQIDGVMGDGATSIVYKAHYYDVGGNVHDVIVKECFPYTAKILRKDAALIWESPTEQIAALNAFRTAHKKLSDIHSLVKLKNSTSAAMELCEANDTLYSVQHLYAGMTYDRDRARKLEDILETTLALTKVIAEYHNHGLLHLDIKPENVLVIPETRQMVILFDVDTVTAMQDIDAGLVDAVPSSEGWAAPEQLSGKLNQLCPATDLFTIGATLFSKVVGRTVTAEDMGIFAQWDFCEDIIADANPRAVRLLRNILKKTIAASVKRRYQIAQELIAALEEAIKAVRDDVFVLSHCPPSTVQFIGREEELAKIHSHFASGCHAVFLYGFGGMGKTELAKKYAECFSQEYDACVFQMYQPEYGLKKYIENIQIHNADGKDAEKQLRGLLKKSRVLLIVDNFDVNDDEYLEELWSLDADILFTTRNDFSDQSSDTIRILNLDALPMGQLLVLFQRVLSRPMSLDDLQAAQKIIESVDNWTMIVPIIAKQIVASGKTVTEYAQMMESDGFRSLDEDTEEIRIRYHGKLHRKTPMDILRYVFDVGALNPAELEALCNVSVLRYHKALTKERYRYYTGAKNLNALNRIINAGWVKCDYTLSLHPMVSELIESDIERTPELLPGIYQYIKTAFENLKNCESVDDGKPITFPLLLLTEMSLSRECGNALYINLVNYLYRFYRENIIPIYLVLFKEPEESGWYMNIGSVMVNCILAAMGEESRFAPKISAMLMLHNAFKLYAKEETDFNVFSIFTRPDGFEGIDNQITAEEWMAEAMQYLDVYTSIFSHPQFDSQGNVVCDTDWKLSLTTYPESYKVFQEQLQSILYVLNLASTYGIEGYEKYYEIANSIIILIEESLGQFVFWGMSQEQILEYKLLSNEEYQIVREASIKSHYTKRADIWYRSLEKTLVHADTPYAIYKSILDADYKISKSFAARLIKKDFVAKLLLDPRLTTEQKHYLLGEFAATQIEKLYRKNCKKKKKLPQFGNRFQNRLAIYAQLLSAVELLLDNEADRMDVRARLCIYRAAYILKKSIGVEILDPKPYILKDIVPENLEWIDLILELAEWTRASGYLKQSKEIKNKLLDCCLTLDFEHLPEEHIQLILYRLAPLASKYQRKDVTDVLTAQSNVRRIFFVDLLNTSIISNNEKKEIIRNIADEFLWEISRYAYSKTISDSPPEISPEYIAYQSLFKEVYPQVEKLFAPGRHVWVDICAAISIPEMENRKQSILFIHDCQFRLERIIKSEDYSLFGETSEIDGLVYLLFENASIPLLAQEAEDILMDLTETAEYTKEHMAEITKNIEKILNNRPAQ